MSPALLERALISLFGDRYGVPDARALSLNRKTIERNVDGETKAGDDVIDKLVALLYLKTERDRELISALRLARRSPRSSVPRGRAPKRAPKGQGEGQEGTADA